MSHLTPEQSHNMHARSATKPPSALKDAPDYETLRKQCVLLENLLQIMRRRERKRTEVFFACSGTLALLVLILWLAVWQLLGAGCGTQ